MRGIRLGASFSNATPGRRLPALVLSRSQLDLDAELVGELLVPVADRDLGHARHVGDLALRPPLAPSREGGKFMPWFVI